MDSLPKDPRLSAKWTNDCCGKKDYDGRVLEISTRYWPQGGGHFVVYSTPGQPNVVEDSSARPEIKPSATSSLDLHFLADNYDDFVSLVEQDFEGETFEDVAAQVEVWAQAQFARVVALLRQEFQPPTRDETP